MILIDTLKNIVIEYIPNNQSNSEIVLSVGESLLLILDACKKAKVDELTTNTLNRLYLEGIKTDADRELVRQLTIIFRDKNYTVKSDPKIINEDATKRYFETHLAYHILQNNAAALDNEELKNFSQNLKKRLFSLPGADRDFLKKVDKILNGDVDKKLLNKYELEYAELANKLLKKDFYGLSEEACENLYEIACSTVLATLNTQIDKSMPIDIYSDSIFTMGMDGRGRIVKACNDNVRTTAKGLMKSTSPLPMYHDLVNPVENDYFQKDNIQSPFERSADQAGFMLESQWSQHLFSYQTQLYSNGISSTTLAQIRNIILQKRLGNSYYDKSFQEYMTSFAALMLYNSGGHSFFEIFEVFKLQICQELILTDHLTQEAITNDNLMYKWLCEDQKDAFNKALEATQIYMRVILYKKILNAQFKNSLNHDNKSDSTNQEGKQILHDAVLNMSVSEFKQLIENSNEKNIDSLNRKKWTVLMVASQLGKTEHVKMLLEAGASIAIQADGLSSLELAIKNKKFDTVQVLLDAGAIIKINDKSNKRLKDRSPALYLACRQNDMRILKLLLTRRKFSITDQTEAILTALKVENLEAVQEIIENMTTEEKQKLFFKKKSLFLMEAMNQGNISIIQKIISLNIFGNLGSTDYDLLLDAAASNDYLPAAKYLLECCQNQKMQQPKKISLNLNKTLAVALTNNNFDMAVLLVIYGADPESISTSHPSLFTFNRYLKKTERFHFLFTEKNMEIVSKRAQDITVTLNKRKNHLMHSLLENLVRFLNRILSNNWRLGYNEKTKTMCNVLNIFNKNKRNIKSNLEQDIKKESSSPKRKMRCSSSLFSNDSRYKTMKKFRRTILK